MDEIRPHRSVKDLVENLLFLSGEPLSLKRLCEYLPYDKEEIAAALDSLQIEYQNRAIKLKYIRDAWILTSDPALSDEIESFFDLQKRKRLSRAALETLAIIAYNQPITRPEIDSIRGVQTSGTIQKLLECELIRVVGKKETLGSPNLYGTSAKFLEHFGLSDLSELPELEYEREGISRPKLDVNSESEPELELAAKITPVDFGLSTDHAEIVDQAQKKGA